MKYREEDQHRLLKINHCSQTALIKLDQTISIVSKKKNCIHKALATSSNNRPATLFQTNIWGKDLGSWILTGLNKEVDNVEKVEWRPREEEHNTYADQDPDDQQ